MELGLADKTVLITGSSAGIGFAAARLFAEEGAEVIVNGRGETRLAKAVDAIEQAVPKARVRAVMADVATAKGTEALTHAVPNVDVLVNNAGIFEPCAFEAISDADWYRFFDTNVMSGVRLSRHYLQGMLSRNWGRILFVSSESGVQIPVEMIHYGVTKTAQLAIARGLAERARGTGVTINSILPGPTRSEGVLEFVSALARHHDKSEAEVEKEFFSTARPSSLIQRFAEPEEVAKLIVFAASAGASAITGASLRVDGGVVRSVF
ncbi:MAG TPA: SDR family NAD(P)-dependent oxidoreductase [Polyangiaceae bacterium]